MGLVARHLALLLQVMCRRLIRLQCPLTPVQTVGSRAAAAREPRTVSLYAVVMGPPRHHAPRFPASGAILGRARAENHNTLRHHCLIIAPLRVNNHSYLPLHPARLADGRIVL